MLDTVRKKMFWMLVIAGILSWDTQLIAQTNPTPQALPYTQDFSTVAYSGTIYPSGWQGWNLSTSPAGSSHLTSAPLTDRALIASSTAANTTGGVHNYNGKIGFLSTASLIPTAVFSINTTGKQNVSVSYDMMLIRNPYDGATNNRIFEAVLQYRVGNTGSFTTIFGSEYLSNTTIQTTSVTAPVNSLLISVILPSVCNNQSEVQLRWSVRQVSGTGGGRPSFAVDNVSATGTDIPPPIITASGTITAMSTTAGAASAEQSFTVSGSNLVGNIQITAPTGFEVSQSSSSGYNSSISLTPSAGTVASSAIYVRISSTAVAGTYGGDITVSTSGATDQVISIPSSTVVAPTGLSQTITFTLASPAVYGAAPIALNGVSDSGLPVTYTSSNTAVVDIISGNLAIVGAGVATVTASQAGNATYNPASDVVQTITISPASLTITSPAVTDKVYNGNDAAVITGTLSGIIGSDVVTLVGTGVFASTGLGSGIAVTSTSTLTGAQAGNYSLIQPTGLTGNIVGAVQTITFNTLPVYSTATLTFTLSATTNATGAPITFSSSNPSVATVSGNTVTIVSAGSTNITASSGHLEISQPRQMWFKI